MLNLQRDMLRMLSYFIFGVNSEIRRHARKVKVSMRHSMMNWGPTPKERVRQTGRIYSIFVQRTGQSDYHRVYSRLADIIADTQQLVHR